MTALVVASHILKAFGRETVEGRDKRSRDPEGEPAQKTVGTGRGAGR